MALPVIVDCDPGHDDMVALLLAGRHADLLAVTTVAGNAPLERSTYNALLAIQLFNFTAHVHPGADRPLTAKSGFATGLHGASGLDGPVLPPLHLSPSPRSAVEAILETTRQVDGCWLIGTGPLTNIALSLRADPTLLDRIAGISIMGGGLSFGNVTAGAEFNLWVDPEAAAIVIHSGAPLIISPLDVTHQLMVTPRFADQVRALDSSIASFMADLFRVFAERYRDVFFDEAIGPLHDPCAVLAVTHPELFEFREMAITVVTGHGPGRGLMLADRRASKLDEPINAKVAVRIDADAALDLVLRAIESIP